MQKDYKIKTLMNWEPRSPGISVAKYDGWVIHRIETEIKPYLPTNVVYTASAPGHSNIRGIALDRILSEIEKSKQLELFKSP